MAGAPPQTPLREFTAPPGLVARFKGLTSTGREGKEKGRNEKEKRRRGNRDRRGKERKGREEERGREEGERGGKREREKGKGKARGRGQSFMLLWTTLATAFAYAGPTSWNSLLANSLKNTNLTLQTSKRHLTTFLFST